MSRKQLIDAIEKWAAAVDGEPARLQRACDESNPDTSMLRAAAASTRRMRRMIGEPSPEADSAAYWAEQVQALAPDLAPQLERAERELLLRFSLRVEGNAASGEARAMAGDVLAMLQAAGMGNGHDAKPVAPADPGDAERPTEPTHTEDFSSVHWRGTTYHFNKAQAVAVRMLWEAWQQGGLSVRQSAIGATLDSANAYYRLVYTFREKDGTAHPAWGTMIVPADVRGSFKLEKGESRKNHETRHGTRTPRRAQSRHGKPTRESARRS